MCIHGYRVIRLAAWMPSRSAMAYGGLMGTVSGVAGGLAATDPKLVPANQKLRNLRVVDTATACEMKPEPVVFTRGKMEPQEGLRARHGIACSIC